MGIRIRLFAGLLLVVALSGAIAWGLAYSIVEQWGFGVLNQRTDLIGRLLQSSPTLANAFADKESVPILAAEPRHFLRQCLTLGMRVIAQNNTASRWQGRQDRRPVGKPVKICHQKPPGKQLRK